MQKFKISHFIIILLLFFNQSYALDKIYFLPKDSKKAKDHIVKLLNNADKKIDIAIYNFSYEKFYKALKKASKKDVKITVFYGKTELKFTKKIKAKKTKRKLHTKLAIIDKNIVIFGSANWTKKSFKENYEVVHITDDKKTVKKYNDFFTQLKEEN